MWSNHISFRFLTTVRSSSYFPVAAWIFLRTSGMRIFVAFVRISSQRPETFSSSAVKVHDSQAYRNMDTTRDRISFIFDPRDMLLSLQTGFSYVIAAVVFAILERGFEPSSETIAPRYLKLVAISSFYPLSLISLLMPLAPCAISLVFSALSPFYTLCRFCRDFQLGSLVPAFLQQEYQCRRQIAGW